MSFLDVNLILPVSDKEIPSQIYDTAIMFIFKAWSIIKKIPTNTQNANRLHKCFLI